MCTPPPISEASPPNVQALLTGRRRILVTGGARLIGGAVVRRLLSESEALVFNLDKCGYTSDLTSIEALPQATESHVDRSIEGSAVYGSTSSPDFVTIGSNVTGTFHLLQAVRAHWEQLPSERRDPFRTHHISTDEVFGSLGATGRFSETTPYDPRSPYSASKAASDHLVNAWHHTHGPWQFPEKLIPVVILKAAAGEPIPLYGDGGNVRDWLSVEDHADALLLAATQEGLRESL